MAEGFARKLAKPGFIVESFGVDPGQSVTDEALRVMSERDVDISGHVPKHLPADCFSQYDLVVFMHNRVLAEAANDVSFVGGFVMEKSEIWDIPDPMTGEMTYEAARDMLESNVIALLVKLRWLREDAWPSVAGSMQSRVDAAAEDVRGLANINFPWLDWVPCSDVDEQTMDALHPPQVRAAMGRRANEKTRQEAKRRINRLARELDTEGQDPKLPPHDQEEFRELARRLRASLPRDMSPESIGSTLRRLLEEWAARSEGRIIDLARNRILPLSDELDREMPSVHSTALLTQALGLYTNHQIFVCSSRIYRVITNHDGLSFDELLRVVIGHEIMHSVLDADLRGEVGEHVAQVLAASVFARNGRDDLLRQVKELSHLQPEEYSLTSAPRRF